MIQERRWLAGTAALALLIGYATTAGAQTRADCERIYTPQRAQEGKDVIWQPVEDSMVGRMLEMAKVTAADTVYDLGSGDGKIVIAAAKQFGAKGIGIEYDADLVEHSRCLAAAEGVTDRASFVQGDLFETDFSDATVVTLYLTPSVNERLMPTLLALKPGTRVVSYSFMLGAWEPDDTIDSFGDGSAYLWIVPADVAGTWTFRSTSGEDSFDVELEQKFQKLRGSAGRSPVAGSLAGDEVRFAFLQGTEHVGVDGVVESDRITANVTRGGTSSKFFATRN